jgi:DNA-binding IclR family transcriptional regulator
MPLYRGATSKIILAHLPTRALKTLFAHHEREIAAVGLGPGWPEFRRALLTIRRAGVSISRGELDPGRVGLAVPIFDAGRSVLGSLSLVLTAARADDATLARLGPLTTAGAREIERLMRGATAKPSPARLKIAR